MAREGHQICVACNRERPEDAFDRKKKILNRVVMNRSCRECIEQVRKRKRDDPRAQACPSVVERIQEATA